jgi:outer membrane protein TolC
LHAKTFAAYADLSPPPLTAEARPPDARQIVFGLELPPYLSGTRCGRVDRARAYQARADSVAEKVRNLVTLEAEEAYLKWVEESRKLTHFRQAAEQAEGAVELADKDFDQNKPSVTYDDVLAAVVLVTQLQARAAESMYQYALSLANLQRATGGAFCPSIELPDGPARLPVP